MLSVDAVFLVPEAFQKNRNMSALANHMNTHEKDVQSGSLLAFVKRAPVKKAVAIEQLQGPAPSQAKLSFSKWKEQPSIVANKAWP